MQPALEIGSLPHWPGRDRDARLYTAEIHDQFTSPRMARGLISQGDIDAALPLLLGEMQ